MKRTSNGKYAKQSAILKEKMIAPVLLILTTAFTWGVSLSPQIYAYTEPVEIVETLVAPTPEPTPEVVEPTPEPKTQRQEIIEYIVEVFEEDAPNAFNVLYCENKGLRADAVNWNSNDTWDAGIFQINQVHGYTMEEMKDYRKNVDAAYKIFLGRGWSSWACSERVDITPFWK